MNPSNEFWWEKIENEQPLLHIKHTHRDGSEESITLDHEDAERLLEVIKDKPQN